MALFELNEGRLAFTSLGDPGNDDVRGTALAAIREQVVEVLGRAVVIVLVLALTIYSLLDCARTPEESMPARMPRFLWIVLIVLVPTIGPVAWIIISRVKAAEERGGVVEPTVWSSNGARRSRAERR